MEVYFNGLSEEEEMVGVDPLASNYETMVESIIQGVPDPRLLPDTLG